MRLKPVSEDGFDGLRMFWIVIVMLLFTIGFVYVKFTRIELGDKY